MGSVPIKFLSNLVINGTTGLAYDSSAYFSNRATNDNLLAGTGTSEAIKPLIYQVSKPPEFIDSRSELLCYAGDILVASSIAVY
jgi:hypothetical protein